MEYEFRMYGFVPYQLNGIQKGIQYGHSVVEYSIKYGQTDEYKKWSEKDKTFVILDGGTTNVNPKSYGTLNKILVDLTVNNINHTAFYEPDLGDQLTAIVFLADQRVWDKENYPDFVEEYDEFDNKLKYKKWLNNFSNSFEEQNKIVFLRNLLKGKKLA